MIFILEKKYYLSSSVREENIDEGEGAWPDDKNFNLSVICKYDKLEFKKKKLVIQETWLSQLNLYGLDWIINLFSWVQINNNFRSKIILSYIYNLILKNK